MALDRKTSVSDGHFAGSGKVFSKDSDGLAGILRGMLIEDAKNEVAAASVASITNNAGGGTTFTTTFADDEINYTAHGLEVGDVFSLTTSGGDQPAPLAVDVIYYVSEVVDANQFKIAATSGGTTIVITDDGTGTHTGFVMKAASMPVATDISGVTTGATGASVEASAVTVEDAHTELASLTSTAVGVDEILSLISAGTVGDGSGVAGDGTIAAIDVDVAVNSGDADSASFQTVREAFDQLFENERAVFEAVNRARVAVGLDKLPVDTLTGVLRTSSGTSLAGGTLATTRTTVVDHADPPTSSVLETEVEAALVILGENITILNAALEDVKAIAASTGPQHYAA